MDKYQILGKISSGAFGTVYDAQVLKGELSGQLVAIKQVYSTDLVKRELELIKMMKPHPNIVVCFEVVEENDFQKNIVMQKGAIDLDHFIESVQYPMSEDIVKIVAKGVLEGLAYLESEKIIHRDLKPSNIVIKQDFNNVAICDFGSAVRCIEDGQYAIQGFTRWYKCPEMLFGSRNYRYQVDIWSLGCILMELATGQQLFPGKTQLEQISLISNFLGDPSPQNWPSITKLHDFGKINFVKKAPKTAEQISKSFGISLELIQFLMKMIKYQGRATAKELLADKFLSNITQNPQGKAFPKGIFFGKKISSKHFK